jgi:hypothetical protein
MLGPNDLTAIARERRRVCRVRLSVPVEIQSADGFWLHATQDLSESGARCGNAIATVPPGKKLDVTIHLPGEQPIACSAEVTSGSRKPGLGMGLRFVDMLSRDRLRLRAFTRQYGALA